ncbi:hypothetical protein MKZ38_006681 [Zalerion maritima]|uniref:Uncharacterized protein n=1 Tax=Zalerion maritima TaxID=339359 RepID=A0AAD5WTX8_9PEZI|nr:hypothetical protein MKZ38_006681 [Zalerion maritima]
MSSYVNPLAQAAASRPERPPDEHLNTESQAEAAATINEGESKTSLAEAEYQALDEATTTIPSDPETNTNTGENPEASSNSPGSGDHDITSDIIQPQLLYSNSSAPLPPSRSVTSPALISSSEAVIMVFEDAAPVTRSTSAQPYAPVLDTKESHSFHRSLPIRLAAKHDNEQTHNPQDRTAPGDDDSNLDSVNNNTAAISSENNQESTTRKCTRSESSSSILNSDFELFMNPHTHPQFAMKMYKWNNPEMRDVTYSRHPSHTLPQPGSSHQSRPGQEGSVGSTVAIDARIARTIAGSGNRIARAISPRSFARNSSTASPAGAAGTSYLRQLKQQELNARVLAGEQRRLRRHINRKVQRQFSQPVTNQDAKRNKNLPEPVPEGVVAYRRSRTRFSGERNINGEHGREYGNGSGNTGNLSWWGDSSGIPKEHWEAARRGRNFTAPSFATPVGGLSRSMGGWAATSTPSTATNIGAGAGADDSRGTFLSLKDFRPVDPLPLALIKTKKVQHNCKGDEREMYVGKKTKARGQRDDEDEAENKNR